MRIYEIEIEDVTYQVAAKNLFGALDLVKALEVPDFDYDNAEDLVVRPVSQRRAEQENIAVDDGRVEVALWTLFNEAKEPQILGCSEWA